MNDTLRPALRRLSPLPAKLPRMFAAVPPPGPAARIGPALRRVLARMLAPGPATGLSTVLSTALGLALLCAPALAPARAQAAETTGARQTMGDIIDSLTHAPPPQQQKQSATGFSGPAGSTGVTKQAPGQTGPSAPTQPKAPVVKALPGGGPGAGQPQQPLPGSAFSPRPAAQSAAQPAAQPAGQPSGQARPRQKPQQAQSRDIAVRVVHDGLERLALVRLPKILEQDSSKARGKGAVQRLPLVLFLHGAGGSARQAMRQTGLAELAERAGFIAAFPEGLAAPPGNAGQSGQEYAGIQTWNAWMCCGYARDQKIDDVGYLAALIARLKADFPVDPRRIHLAGFSNGAMLASRFVLERPGVAASLASVAGYLPCDQEPPAEPLPVLIIHGNHDRVARFGPAPGQPRTGIFCEDFPAKAEADFWVRGMRLKSKARQVKDGGKSRVRLERYGPDTPAGRALGRGQVDFIIVKGGGHAWPGGPAERYRYCDLPTPDPEATALVWDFFKRQVRPAALDKPAPPRAAGKKGGKSRG